MSGDALPAGADAPSPLGRYAPHDDAPLMVVRLLNLPVRLLAAGREHHDGLLREFRLLALSGGSRADPVPSRLAELTAILGEHYAAAAARGDEVTDAALQRGDLTVDVETRVPVSAAEALATVAALLDEADALCAQEVLMTMQRPPVLRRFADWYTAQFVDQAAGRPPTPWDGPLTLDGST